MNQILKPEILSNQKNNDTSKRRKYKFYKIQFIISCFISICFIFAFLIRIFTIYKNKKISEQLMNIYHISTLYSNDTNYSAQPLRSNFDNYENISSTNPFVIGIIKIDKINLNYPILFETNKDFLNIAVCRFAGPLPNETGNLCIAGHNYVDYKFFSRLHELEIEDIVKIYDLSGKMVEYKIYQKYEVEATNLSCTSQNTDGKNIITLLTCNNISGKRLVLVGKPI